MARHDLRRNFRSAVDPRGTRAHSARTASAARGKRPFPEFRAAARRHLRHAALPQPGRRAHAAGPHLARRGHGQTLLRGPGRKRLLAFPEHRHRHRPALSGRRGGQIRRHADARPAGSVHSAGRSLDFQPAGFARLAGHSRLSDNRRAAGRSADPLAALHRTAHAAQTHLFRPRDDPHFTPAAALRTLPAGHGRRLVLHHRRRIGRSGRLIPQGDIKPVSFQKSFDFALVFVPLHRGRLPCQPIMAACSRQT